MNNQTLSFVPKQLVTYCKQDPSNIKSVASTISDMANEEVSFKIFIENRFFFSFENDFLVKFLTEYGVKEFRNELALAYLSFHMDQSYYSSSAHKDLEEILKIEDELGEFFSSNDYNVFTLLFHLKSIDILNRKEGRNTIMGEYDFFEIKKILILYSKSSKRSDWLLVLLKSLLDIFKNQTISIIEKNKGQFYQILDMLGRKEQEILILNHLAYGQAISDTDYFLYNKV